MRHHSALPLEAFANPSGSARSRLLSRKIGRRGLPDRWSSSKHGENAHVLRAQTYGEPARDIRFRPALIPLFNEELGVATGWVPQCPYCTSNRCLECCGRQNGSLWPALVMPAVGRRPDGEHLI